MIFISFGSSVLLLGPVFFSDWHKFYISSSLKLHVWWNCFLVGMFLIKPSKCLLCVSMIFWKSKMATTARQSFNIGSYGKMKNKISQKPESCMNPNCTGIVIGWSLANHIFVLCQWKIQDGHYQRTYLT